MSNILTISKREITRLRTRFNGKSRIIVAAVLALAMILSYVIYHQDLALSKGLYNIGVSSDGPAGRSVLLLGRRATFATGSADLQFHTVAEADNQATVSVQGTINGYLNAKPHQEPIDRRLLLVFEEGQWRWCGDAP